MLGDASDFVGIVNESFNPHGAAALWAAEWIDEIDLFNAACPLRRGPRSWFNIRQRTGRGERKALSTARY
jgi:hypothetical protein